MPDAASRPRLDPYYCRFDLSVEPSSIHRWGIFSRQPIPPRRKVIEYTGQRVNRKEAKKRGRRHHIYLFTLDLYWSIDGAVCGSGAEYINHSCDPNLRAMIMHEHILFMSRRWIAAGEELTLDYHIGKNAKRIPCVCGTPDCRGTLNIL